MLLRIGDTVALERLCCGSQSALIALGASTKGDGFGNRFSKPLLGTWCNFPNFKLNILTLVHPSNLASATS